MSGAPRIAAGRRARRAVLPPAVLALVVGLAVSTAACGIPSDDEPRVIAAENAPIDLNPINEDEPAGGAAEVTLYFILGGRLVTIDRATGDDTPDVAINALLAGPTEAEALGGEGDAQITTRIPDETELRGITIDGNVATIDLGCAADVAADPAGCGVLGVRGDDQVTLFAQLVCTADDFRAIASVRFLQEGQPQQAPLPEGPTSEPVRCLDYRELHQET